MRVWKLSIGKLDGSQSLVSSSEMHAAWIDLHKNQTSEWIKLSTFYRTKLDEFTQFDSRISAWFERIQITHSMSENVNIQKLTIFCAEATVALQRRNRDFFAHYWIKLENWKPIDNKLYSWFNYRQKNFQLQVKWGADFVKKSVMVEAEAKYVIHKQVNLWWSVLYDSSTWAFVPNIKVTQKF